MEASAITILVLFVSLMLQSGITQSGLADMGQVIESVAVAYVDSIVQAGTSAHITTDSTTAPQKAFRQKREHYLCISQVA